MKKTQPKRNNGYTSRRKLAGEFRALSHQILQFANRGLTRVDFAREISKLLVDFSGCDVLELRLRRADKYFLCHAKRGVKNWFWFEQLPCSQTEDGKMIPCSELDSGVETLCRKVILGQIDPSLPFFTENGGFWTGDTSSAIIKKLFNKKSVCLDKEYRSLVLLPLLVESDNVGLLQLKSKKKDYFTNGQIEFYEGLARTLGVALAHRNAQVGLRERIKELTCLFGIARFAAQPGMALEEMLRGIAELLPPAWLYPDSASGRIILDGHSFASSNYREGSSKQIANIIIDREYRGLVEVSYVGEKPELDEGPFLKEERNLIDAVAREVGIIVERREVEEETSRLHEQLRHADRLATIGQLAAGVAHELNEPLGNVLGFAQLAKKSPGLPEQARQDIEKAVIASLHAREVVKKLMFFARRMPPKKTQVNLNRLVDEALYFLGSRCEKEGIEVVRLFSPELPEITADPAQLTQVLVNLVVNAVQAMPQGGKLTVETGSGEGYISLTVEDTGMGMANDVVKKIFLPFFTTKDINEGTGLGLSVVHGIVNSHGGSIKVESQINRGSRFEVKLPLTGAPDVEEGD